ncbi:hypothetical protein GUITHDRAFT_134404 [Guillardia theta CCMP2712]|uniref:LysM domain-containing protein n=1 Tax=Guillardia theta (strain CCMP2712) TaxID=905079 RepID=L1JSQ5_GUITC|nr:hypothetical protein GUITHDRAFT_134404 [Guillardia theta CCMP2712]EKX51477.1 hypothetical protein GUITHDRAFT_134404 [Guillardia theta CCMP2712]|eukprot:XP_005838457.1 hypothetical protein GUITHDRAFT_134404 [Guillardia theta CCMP2712]
MISSRLLFLSLAWLTLASMVSAQNFLGGSLTWAIDPNFLSDASHRVIEFKLQTSFIKTADVKLSCVLNEGSAIQCSGTFISQRFGRLCTVAYKYSKNPNNDDVVLTPADTTAQSTDCPGVDNAFTVTQIQDINKVTVVSGELKVSVTVGPTEAAVLAYLRIPGATTATPSDGLFLRQCVRDSPQPSPCRLNPVSQNIWSDPYWKGLFSADGEGSWFQSEATAPALATLQALAVVCPSTASSAVPGRYCSSAADIEKLQNFYSPRPGFPPIVEVPTSVATESADLFTADQRSLAPFKNWFFSDKTAPYPPFRLKAADYDGQEVKQFFLSAQSPGLQCWGGDINGSQAGSGQWPYPFDSSAVCSQFYDGDGSNGATVKFDFNFASLCANVSECNASSTFTQHLVLAADRPFPDVDNPSANVTWPFWQSEANLPKGALVQSIFAAYPCYSGEANQAPVMMRSLGQFDSSSRVVTLDSNSFDVPSEFTCKANEECKFPLSAQDFSISADGCPSPDNSCSDRPDPLNCSTFTHDYYRSCDTVRIEFAPFWESGNGSLVAARCSKSDVQCSVDSDCGVDGGVCEAQPTKDCEGVGAVKCFFREYFSEQQIGATVTRCFTSKDIHNADSPKLTCRSLPTCIKIRIESHSPQFVAPTPMDENSYDDLGNLVPGRTDVHVCEGYPMAFKLSAEDPDQGDQVRIYVEDKDVDLANYNLDFFKIYENSLGVNNLVFPSQCSGSLDGKGFKSYGGTRAGDNGQQNSVEPLSSAQPKSIVSDYASSVLYTTKPLQEIRYLFNITQGNGIIVRTLQACNNTGSNVDTYDCREKILNMDQVICGVAYDNSRFRAKRWVGKANPNSPTLPSYLRDHSNGDMTSAPRCWRIRLQAPPVFVTDPSLTASPFGRLVLNGLDSSSPDYKSFVVGIGSDFSATFIAQDPNPKDVISLFVLADPGMPAGMTASPTICIPRLIKLQNEMCMAQDHKGEFPIILNGTDSKCSKAKLVLSWKPQLTHVGQTYQICVQARDDSTSCAGKGPAASAATSRGWYGEKQCISLSVAMPMVTWDNFGPNEIDAYVGCTAWMEVKASTVVGYHAVISSSGTAPAGSVLQGATSKEVNGRIQATRRFMWMPQRGSEGQQHLACFTASDNVGHQTLQVQCWTFRVQKCQYCIQSGDTLREVMKDYGIDTNWFRLWLHNGNPSPVEAEARIDNPDLIVHPLPSATLPGNLSNYYGFPIIWVGLLYQIKGLESFSSTAVRFQTTMASMLSVNPDIKSEQDVLGKTPLVCVVPCTKPLTAV